MKKRIYTDKLAALEFNSEVLLFNNEALTFWVRGLTHFDVEGFTYSEKEMEMASIELDLYVEPDMIPAFDKDWYVEFRGEKFTLITLTPSCVKDTSSLRYKYTLVFKSQRADLQRYEFANYVSTGGTQQLISYDFTLPLTVQDFVERFNINLEYYFGSGVWNMVLDDSYMDNLTTTIYDGTSRVTTAFSRETLWSLLTGLYDIYGLRWKITDVDGVMTITLGYTPITLSHTFKYGFEEGLTSFERVNSQPDVYTRLSGKGSSINLPYRYFDTATDDYIEDPDNNTYTQNIPYTGLMPKSYRDYVKGWNGTSIEVETYAYLKGVADASVGNDFNPVDYVISESAEAIYGIRKGSVEDNDDIHPTLQNVSTASLGRLDEIVSVEAVLNDDYNDTDTSLNTVVTEAVLMQKYQKTTASADFSLSSAEFEIIEDFGNIAFSVTFADASLSNEGDWADHRECLFGYTVEVMSGESTIDSSTISVDHYGEATLSTSFTFKNLDPGTYKIAITGYFYVQVLSRNETFSVSLSAITRSQTNEYQEIFDIWIKNIWDSSQNSGESDDTYMHRIWDPLVAPSEDMTVMFSDGLLAGSDYKFTIAVPSDSTDYYIYHDETKSIDTSVGTVNSHWRLSLMKSDAELEASDYYLPTIAINASAGDHFYFTGIEMPYYPYVYDAEEREQVYLENELAKVNDENPTYTIKPSAAFLESYSENASIGTGVKVNIGDPQIFGSDPAGLFISNVTIEYKTGVLLPEWTITVVDEPTSSKNAVSILQGDVKVLSSNLTSAASLIEQVELKLDSRYLRKDGESDVSYSKTTFKDSITTTGSITSSSFLQGQVGGYGYSIYKDANGYYVLEIDKLNIRKTLTVNELVINQVSIYGGVHVYSAACMTVSSIDSSNASYHVCYLDIKNGTVLNQFAVGDHAYCQRFDPETNDIIKYYWKPVLEVGYDYIVISADPSVGDGDGVPAVGDNIAQLGNATNTARQSALIIDQTNGGTVTQYAEISGYTLTDKEFIQFGFDPSTGRAFETIYGDAYIGGRNSATDNYIKFDSSTGIISFRGVITQDSTVVDSVGNESALTVDRGAYSPTAIYYVGNTVYYLGSTYYCDVQTTAGTPPTDTGCWHVMAEAGSDGISVVNSNQSHTVPASTDGIVSSYTGSGTTIRVYEGSTLLQYSYVWAAGKFTIGTPIVSPSGSITVGSRSGGGTTTALVNVHSAMSNSEDVVTITYPLTINRADGSDVTMSTTQTITKSKTGATGAAAKRITLSATSQMILETELGVRTPTAISVVGVGENTSISAWTYSVDGGNFSSTVPTGLSRTGLSVNISTADVTFNTLSIKATDGSISDTLSIALAEDGSSAISVMLTNESHTVSADSSGNLYSGELAKAVTAVKVFRGGTELTIGSDYYIEAVSPSSGLTFSLNGADVQLTSMDSSIDSGYADITINDTDEAWGIEKRFSIAKSLAGATGTAGTAAKLVTVTASSNIISQAKDGTTTPTTITVNASTQGSVGTMAWMFSVDGGTFSATVPTDVSVNSATLTITSASATFTTLSCKYTDGTYYDTGTISRVIDGSDALTMVLSNPAHNIQCASDGTYTSEALDLAYTEVRVYRGSDIVDLIDTGIDISVAGMTALSELGSSSEYIKVYAESITANNAYADITLDIDGLGVEVLTQRFTVVKSLAGAAGATGAATVSIYCESQSLSVTPSTNAFTKAISVKLFSGTTAIPYASWTSYGKTVTNMAYGSDTHADSYSYTVNLTGFTLSTVTVGYVTVSIIYGGVTYSISISVARVFNSIEIRKGSWVSGTSYIGNCIQRDVVKYTNGVYYAVKTSVGTFTSSTAPSTDTTNWEALNSFENIATGTLLADNANIAEFIYKDAQMISQSGTINGDASTNWDSSLFVPNLTLDGSTGIITARNAVIQGAINASSGIFSGELDAVTGTFVSLQAYEDPSVQIVLGDEGLMFHGDLSHQGVDSSGNAWKFRTGDVWCRGVFGSTRRTAVVVDGSTAIYYVNGIGSSPYYSATLTSATDTNSNTYYSLPLYGTSGTAAGFPVDLVIFRVLSGTYRYRFTGLSVGKKFTLINANDNSDIYFYCGGLDTLLSGGCIRECFYLYNLLYPAQTAGILGYGLMLGAEYDNDW